MNALHHSLGKINNIKSVTNVVVLDDFTGTEKFVKSFFEYKKTHVLVNDWT